MRTRLSIIITCDHNRDVRSALASLSRIRTTAVVEVIVVLFGLGRRALGDHACVVTRGLSIARRPFNKALGINLGALYASADNLFLMDADVAVTARTLETGLRHLADGSAFATIRKVRGVDSIPPRRIEERVCQFSFSDAHLQVTTSRSYADGSRAGPGLVFVTREHFMAVDGMNSDLIGWGWEDIDLLIRLQIGLGLRRREVGSAVHFHREARRSRDELRRRAASERANMYRALVRYHRAVFRGTFTTDARAAARKDIAVELFR